tara:strand:+ start:108 stop:470 length:363 start_codon:yes stop_codon:yes gene_type:complete
MRLVFQLDGVICKPEDKLLWRHAHPLTNVVEFMQWLTDNGHHLTIWCERENTLENKLVTEQWLMLQQVPYDRLLFDRPKTPIFVDETPPNAKYHSGIGDNDIIAMLFEEWKEWKQEEQKE